MTTEYIKAKQLLQSQGKFYINLGLERIQAVIDLIGNPQNNMKIIHIAGTNGKGSVCAILANILKSAGYKTGLYTSPHLEEYTERIKINNKDIPKNDFAEYILHICNIADKNKINLTEFEILTASALKYFSDKKVEYAVLETGLGGRYDAVNICRNTLLSIITSISLDHTDRLGNTYEEIAFEKAGIIKENSTVITSQENKGYEVIRKVAAQKKAKLITLHRPAETVYENNINYAVINNKKYKFPLLGLYQKDNLALALEAAKFLNINEHAITEGIQSVHWPARIEYICEKNILIDGAHNPDAAQELKKSIDFYFADKERLFIYSTLNTKDYKTIAKTLFNENDEIFYLEFNHKNALTFEEYKKNVPWLKNIKKADSIEDILKDERLKVITGSLYMIGEIYPKISKKRDV